MSTQPLARSLAESSPAPGARKRARTSSVVPSDAQRLAMLKVSDYDAWLGECKAKWRVLRKKLAVVRDFVKHEAGAASARDDGGDRSGALAGAPGGGLRGALAGLRAKPRKHEGLTRWKSVKPEDVRLGDGEKLQRALVALAKLASTADGPRLRRPGDANVSLLADAEALDAGPARGGAEGAAADASALATRAFQPFEAEDMADTEEDEDDDEGDEGDEDEDEEGEEEEEMDEDEDAVGAGFVAAEDASPETAPTSRRAPPPRFPSLPPPARMCSRARTTPSRRTARVRLFPASRSDRVLRPRRRRRRRRRCPLHRPWASAPPRRPFPSSPRARSRRWTRTA